MLAGFSEAQPGWPGAGGVRPEVAGMGVDVCVGRVYGGSRICMRGRNDATQVIVLPALGYGSTLSSPDLRPHSPF